MIIRSFLFFNADSSQIAQVIAEGRREKPEKPEYRAIYLAPIALAVAISFFCHSGVILYFWRNKSQIGVWEKSDRK
ncbi:hypothetical protein [Aerosakkonema funiforme]|uniref:hypothetical protein n=1 Tax=Aerosakkonema funiforme TaxID=1246630 RepID=UPI0035B92F33